MTDDKSDDMVCAFCLGMGLVVAKSRDTNNPDEAGVACPICHPRGVYEAIETKVLSVQETPKCPDCGSTDIRTNDRGSSQCWSCGQPWPLVSHDIALRARLETAEAELRKSDQIYCNIWKKHFADKHRALLEACRKYRKQGSIYCYTDICAALDAIEKEE